MFRYLAAVACVALALSPLAAAEPLPGTQLLTEEGVLHKKMVDGIHKYLDRAIAESVEKRKQFWKLDFSSPEAYAKSVEPNRQRLKKYLGVVDHRLPPKMEYVGGPDQPALVAETDKYKVFAVRWVVLPGVDGEGLLLEPKGKALANVVAIPDADWTPEMAIGLAPGLPVNVQFPRHLAENGCRVIIPVLIDRKDDYSANPKLRRATNQPHREFIHRMAYEMGRTLIGYEIHKVLACVDWFKASGGRQPPDSKIGIYGYGEGGIIAKYATAIDPRIDSVVISGSFGPREKLYEEPIYRNVWGLLGEFGDGELLRLILPRNTILEVARFDSMAGPPSRAGRGGAAPGNIESPSFASVWNLFDPIVSQFADKWTGPGGFAVATFGLNATFSIETFELSWFHGPGFKDTLAKFYESLTERRSAFKDLGTAPVDIRKAFVPGSRQKRQFDQLVAYTQKLWRDSDAVRKAYWAKADASSLAAWEKSTETYRDYFHSEVIGKLPEPTMPLNPRTRQVYNEPKWTGYEVMLDVYPDVFASGILLLPKDLKPGEKRPVVVCQHGLEGTPRSTIDPEKSPVYAEFSKHLAEKGYIVYAPQNPYIGSTHFRQIQRKAQPLKASLFSFIVRQHQRTLDWLETLPNVDPKRIAFYGLSYGGKTAMRVPAIEKRYCLSICSADFNEWIGKNVSVELDRSYMWTVEYDMYEFDLGNTFNYAEMAYLIAPRPFMVERGHDDGVGTDEMVSYEYAKIRYLYANRLKMPERTEIEYQPGGHRIYKKGTYAFLAKHLKWNR
ncbi:MAG TPA: dienelactone hydrolase family protein [Urbifossiella sp.]|nr:dienelactone hydrolase family protein [Urbifossiella sp.]